MQGKRTRALDSRGRPVRGIYVRDGRFEAGFQCPQTSKWRMQALNAETLTEARRERDSLLGALREQRVTARNAGTFADLFAEFQLARDLSERTCKHERELADRHLSELKSRRVQEVSAVDVARIVRNMRSTYSEWTAVAVYRILRGSFALAVRRGLLTRSPVDGLSPGEIPKQRNAKRIAVLDSETMDTLVRAGRSERWRAALALAGYAGLRLGEIRGLTWTDVDLKEGTVSVRQAMSREGETQAPKTEAGVRTMPILPALRRELVAWKLRSVRTKPADLVIATVEGALVQERNFRRALEAAKKEAGLDRLVERLSWHSLRHSYASMLATDLELPATTLARLAGHADAGFTLKVYARDRRDNAALVADVLARAERAEIGV